MSLVNVIRMTRRRDERCAVYYLRGSVRYWQMVTMHSSVHSGKLLITCSTATVSADEVANRDTALCEAN